MAINLIKATPRFASFISHRTRGRCLNLSFSGAGHLLPYHLGVSLSIQAESSTINISNVAGSSSGSVAAAAFALLSRHQVEEYAARFISEKGRAMYHLKQILNDEPTTRRPRFNLHVATTRCSDGSLRLFSFPSESTLDTGYLLKCLEASCRIPQHFHPFDVLPNRWFPPSSYPESDGVIIDGCSHVDGGISAPCPSSPDESVEGAINVQISPFSGSSSRGSLRISPSDDSWRLLPFDVTCRGDFDVHPSLQNIRAMQASAGLTDSATLRKWFERGVEDGNKAMTKL